MCFTTERNQQDSRLPDGCSPETVDIGGEYARDVDNHPFKKGTIQPLGHRRRQYCAPAWAVPMVLDFLMVSLKTKAAAGAAK